MEALFLRDDDIPQAVAMGVADIGVVGENEMLEKKENVVVAKRLGFSKCRLSLAIPKDDVYNGVEYFNGKKIATSYPEILKGFFTEKKYNCRNPCDQRFCRNCSRNRIGRCLFSTL